MRTTRSAVFRRSSSRDRGDEGRPVKRPLQFGGRLISGTLWGFDIECAGWDQLVIAVAISEHGDVLVMRTREEVRDWYLSTGSEDLIVSHYGGGYDFIFLCTCVLESWSVRLAGSTIASMRVRGHAECRDTMKLFPGSLDGWTGQKTRLDKDLFPCKCEEEKHADPEYDCGGYCSITLRMSRPKLESLTSYAINDVEIMMRHYVDDIWRLHSLGFSVFDHRDLPRLTVGALAWQTAAPMSGQDPKLPISWNEYDVGIAAYFGGRTEVGRTFFDDLAWVYDVNSMYPWALTLPVPIGRRKSLTGEEARRAYRADRPGTYFACVYVPDDSIWSPLPHRAKGLRIDGKLSGMRLIWSNGYIKGWWTLIELRQAEAFGAKIALLAAAEVYEREAPIYKPFVDHVYGLREKAMIEGDKRWSARLKWIANSLTGKLAQNPEQSSARVLAVGEDPPDIDCTDPTKPRWRWAGGRVWISPPVRRVPSCARTIHAAYLTSRARAEKLLPRLRKHEDLALYCDTDSTTLGVQDDEDVHDTRIGAYKLERRYLPNTFGAAGPKDYRGKDDPTYQPDRKDAGKPVVRIKGIPRASWATWDQLRAGAQITSRIGVDKLRSAEGEFRRRELTRTSHASADRAGTRHVTPDGRTRPLFRHRDGSYT